MKTLKVNTKVIAALNPCTDRFNNWKDHYESFDMDILYFLDLPNITAKDKIWVAVRLLPKELVEIFAIDCAVKAATAAYTATATYAATYTAATDAAAYTAAYTATDAAAYTAYTAAAAADAAADAATYTAATDAREASLNDSVDALAWLIIDSRNNS